MNIELTENEVVTLKIALDELLNSGDWEYFLEEDDPTPEEIHDAIDSLKERLYDNNKNT